MKHEEQEVELGRFALGIKKIKNGEQVYYQLSYAMQDIEEEVILAKVEAFLTRLKKKYLEKLDESLSEFKNDEGEQ